MSPNNRIQLNSGLDFVSHLVGVPEIDIVSKKRFRDAVIARHFLRYLLRTKFDLTYQTIGDLTNCNHASAIHSVKYINECARFDKLYSSYKESIDSGVIENHSSARTDINNILSARRNNEYKCNALISLINGYSEGTS